ncbi:MULTISPECIES: HepT-like ribonuclease domain-containing protein [unclassified Sulfurospirillum]|uniref:HepT-like ribonuclease domain-containing protein n=1 Tax=unclassified Sulfurospirillum TaxID=2618290 RepID=UPI0004FF6844|nr:MULTISPECIES: HepT-like ribonuclease domain-containing protein [unclassified Sulfurospirillum]KFL34478.1 hypothetical protein JU57_05550 [Sulfurospirillum sp. SCADC]
MFKTRDKQRLETIHEKIIFIENIVQKNRGIMPALEDKEIAKPAILMHLTAIAEQFSKLKHEEFTQHFCDAIKGSMSIRNFIAHDYDGVNLTIIEITIRDVLPALKFEIEQILRKD